MANNFVAKYHSRLSSGSGYHIDDKRSIETRRMSKYELDQYVAEETSIKNDTSYKLYLDDVRSIPKDWVGARTYIEAINIIAERGIPTVISFDHDLGENQPTGMDFAKWFTEFVLFSENKIELPSNFTFYVHSSNPPGKANIEGLMNQFLTFYKTR